VAVYANKWVSIRSIEAAPFKKHRLLLDYTEETRVHEACKGWMASLIHMT